MDRQVGYCGLDKEDPGSSRGGLKELDVMSYCRGYVAWDLTALLIQVVIHACTQPQLSNKDMSVFTQVLCLLQRTFFLAAVARCARAAASA